MCRHSYGWPRLVNGTDVQTCTRCSATKKSKLQLTAWRESLGEREQSEIEQLRMECRLLHHLAAGLCVTLVIMLIALISLVALTGGNRG